jgi:hypothetical protein
MKVGNLNFTDRGTAIAECQICSAKAEFKQTEYMPHWGLLVLVNAGANAHESTTVRLGICPDCVASLIDDCPQLASKPVKPVTAEELAEIATTAKQERRKKLFVVAGGKVTKQ